MSINIKEQKNCQQNNSLKISMPQSLEPMNITKAKDIQREITLYELDWSNLITRKSCHLDLSL